LSSLKVFVPETHALETGAACVFRFRRGGSRLEGFVLQTGEQLVAYANECPHWHVDLDLGDGKFWDPDSERILCKNHAALFDPSTGECVVGPCIGLALEAFPLTEASDGSWIEVPDAEPDEPMQS
jgi:nitrite reductase/ring-hydroxylating ferredoxin subunit